MLITKSPLTNVPEQVGPECVVVFPGLPCEVMMLPEPLKTVVPPRAPHPQPCIPLLSLHLSLRQLLYRNTGTLQ